MKHYLYFLLVLTVLSCSKQDPEPVRSSSKSIQAFSFNTLTPVVNASLDSAQQTITATLPIGTDISKLIPTISLSNKATIIPASGIVQDFSKPVSYTVTAEDGTTRIYTTKITVLKSSAKSIISFSFSNLTPTVKATIDSVNRVITATVPINTDLTKLAPSITISDRASVSPASGAIQDFSKSVTYTVTAENGDRQSYTVQVNVLKSSAKLVRSFTLNSLSPVVTATVDTTNKTILAIVPVGTNLTTLIPTITVSDKATISPASGAIQNFTNSVTYTITAENGTKETYRVNILSIKDDPIQPTAFQQPFVPTKILCKKGIFTSDGFGIELHKQNVTCNDFAISPVSFNIPKLAVGVYRGDGPFFSNQQGTSISFFGCIVQITKVTATTVEGKVRGGQAGENYIEGTFTATICP